MTDKEFIEWRFKRIEECLVILTDRADTQDELINALALVIQQLQAENAELRRKLDSAS